MELDPGICFREQKNWHLDTLCWSLGEWAMWDKPWHSTRTHDWMRVANKNAILTRVKWSSEFIRWRTHSLQPASKGGGTNPSTQSVNVDLPLCEVILFRCQNIAMGIPYKSWFSMGNHLKKCETVFSSLISHFLHRVSRDQYNVLPLYKLDQAGL